ncbi:hypothetical protein BJ138DRAFT_1226931 [Hygrophoropsis aurantiaca]|uniref:Uncharacterized protein n=1 Tax=Hygrophoropsis aurantiaca TaxID=72124 RepID=A0ACB7ZXJ4_9AGAM|nr:hypothetical protein BJ138DRAFT_1226931 [Hygrophoropsis aurantiaca]
MSAGAELRESPTSFKLSRVKLSAKVLQVMSAWNVPCGADLSFEDYLMFFELNENVSEISELDGGWGENSFHHLEQVPYRHEQPADTIPPHTHLHQDSVTGLRCSPRPVLQGLPSEILCDVINYLPIRSILALRQVSKYLNQATRVRSIWVHAYRTSSLVRPPGPFTWQTAQVLESNLIQSARLSLKWPPNLDAKPARSRVIPLTSAEPQLSLLCGRWLLIVQKYTRIMCYDLNKTDNWSARSCSILYESPDRFTEIEYFECESIPAGDRSRADDQNRVAFLVIVENNEVMKSLPTRTLYKVNIAEDTSLALTMVLQTNVQPFHCRLTLGLRHVAVQDIPIQGNWFTTNEGVVLYDSETYQRYKFPNSAPKTVEGHSMFIAQIIISSTHILFHWVYSFLPFSNDSTSNYIQAYTIPPPQASKSASSAGQFLSSAPMTLQLSHEGTIPGLLGKCTLLRDSKIDQLTGTIDILLSESRISFGTICAVSVKLAPGRGSIGSITLNTRIRDVRVGRMNGHMRFAVNPCFNGLTRGVASVYEGRTCHVAAFVLDGEDGENTQTIVDRDMKFFRELELDAQTRIVGFDAYRGRIITQSRCTLTIFDFV